MKRTRTATSDDGHTTHYYEVAFHEIRDAHELKNVVEYAIDLEVLARSVDPNTLQPMILVAVTEHPGQPFCEQFKYLLPIEIAMQVDKAAEWVALASAKFKPYDENLTTLFVSEESCEVIANGMVETTAEERKLFTDILTRDQFYNEANTGVPPGPPDPPPGYPKRVVS